MNGSVMDSGAANEGVNHTQARADTCSRVKSGEGGREGACRAGGGGDGAGGVTLLLVPAQTYPKLFHLFFLQARGVKIEA